MKTGRSAAGRRTVDCARHDVRLHHVVLDPHDWRPGGASFNGDRFNVHPLVTLNGQWNNVGSEHTVTILDSSGASCASSFEVEAVQASVPAALWGSPGEDSHGNPQALDPKKLLVSNQLTGVSVRVKAPTAASPLVHRCSDEPGVRRAGSRFRRSSVEQRRPVRQATSLRTVLTMISRIASLENGVASSRVRRAAGNLQRPDLAPLRRTRTTP